MTYELKFAWFFFKSHKFLNVKQNLVRFPAKKHPTIEQTIKVPFTISAISKLVWATLWKGG